MNPLIRFFAALICFVVAFQAVWLWDQTGRARTTNFMDPTRSADALVSADPDPVQQILVRTGMEEDGANERRVNRFQFGLMPSGPDRGAMSVATVGGPAGLVGIWLLFGSGKPKKGGKKDKK
jgi:hypothetical protein